MSEKENLPPIDEIEEPVDTPMDDAMDDLGEDDLDAKAENTITFKRAHLYTFLLPLAFVTGLLVGFIFWGRSDASVVDRPEVAQDSQGQVAPQGAEPTPDLKRYDIPEDDDPVIGPDNAPITIIEFSDYECPYCLKWHVEVWPQLQAEYGDQIRLVYRDFPLSSIHSNALPAAVAANCAREQDKYWEFSEKLFDTRFNLGLSAYQTYAEELNLDLDAFNACLESGRYEDEVQADYDYAVNLGVRSTPTFFVNGIPVVGAQPFEVFKNLIDQELAGELPK